MNRSILVINSKGGSGKSTISTNLASFYAKQGLKTALMDYDPQGSSLHWLKNRPAFYTTIHGANAAPAAKGSLRSWSMSLPQDLDTLIIDAPAGVNGIVLQEMCRKAKIIIIPVAPSSIDIHATADFIKQLKLVGKIQPNKTSLAVVANRVRSNIPIYEPLRRFLTSLHIPFVASITDSPNFVEAAEKGMGIFDMEAEDVTKEIQELTPLLQWIENPTTSDRLDADGNDILKSKLVYLKKYK